MNYNKTTLEDLEGETWVDAFGFDGIYEVSNLGRIKSLGRYVNIRNGQRWVNERIRKQCLVSDGRLTCPLYSNGGESINVAAVIFLSFNLKVDYNVKTHCIMHIDKNQSNNELTNLKIEKISKSHTVNYEKKLLPHLKVNTDKMRSEYLKIKERKCRDCKEVKEIGLFRYGSKQCLGCRRLQQKEYYKNKKMAK